MFLPASAVLSLSLSQKKARNIPIPNIHNGA